MSFVLRYPDEIISRNTNADIIHFQFVAEGLAEIIRYLGALNIKRDCHCTSKKVEV